MALPSGEAEKINLRDINGKLTDEFATIKLIDVDRKLQIAYNVVDACKKEAEHEKLLFRANDIENRLNFYTKVKQCLIHSSNQLIRSKEAHSEWVKTNMAFYSKPRIYENVRKIYVDSILIRNQIPTLKDFEVNFDIYVRLSDRKAFVHHLSSYLSKLALRNLKENGYTWVKIPGTLKSLIVEKPSQVRTKCEYFSKITQYRDEGREIVYIDERSSNAEPTFYEEFYYTDDMKGTHPYFIIAANKNGLLHSFFYANCSYHCALKTFILDFASKATRPTVFVLGEKYYHIKNECPLPEPHSPKTKMSEFLSKNNIPHNENSPKAELYSLVQKCKHTCKTNFCMLDDTVNSCGHVILRRPFILNSLNFFSDFRKVLRDNVKYDRQAMKNLAKFKADILKALDTIPLEDWAKTEENLIKMENTMYTEDVKIEEIVDKILMMAEDGQITESDAMIAELDTYTNPDSYMEKIVI